MEYVALTRTPQPCLSIRPAKGWPLVGTIRWWTRVTARKKGRLRSGPVRGQAVQKLRPAIRPASRVSTPASRAGNLGWISRSRRPDSPGNAEPCGSVRDCDRSSLRPSNEPADWSRSIASSDTSARNRDRSGFCVRPVKPGTCLQAERPNSEQMLCPRPCRRRIFAGNKPQQQHRGRIGWGARIR